MEKKILKEKRKYYNRRWMIICCCFLWYIKVFKINKIALQYIYSKAKIDTWRKASWKSWYIVEKFVEKLWGWCLKFV